MATTQLSDVFIPDVYGTYSTVNSVEKTAFFDSGVVIRNDLLDSYAEGAGRKVELPFWKDLDASSEPNLSNDDPTDIATPDKIQAAAQEARKAFLNNGWSAADLTGELAGSEPMQAIRNRTGVYWQRQFQRRLLASVGGVLADNVANDSGDMVHNASIADGDNAAEGNLFGRSIFTSAAFTLGDMVNDLTAIAVHSMIMKRMVDNDDITYIPDSQGNLTIPTYMGRRIIVDDNMPVVAGGTSGFVYTSVLFGNAAFGYGEGTPAVPAEIEREANQGNGGGVETLWERKTWLLHPFGFEFTSASVSDESPSIAELKAAGNWNRVVDRKNVPLAFIQTNG